MNSYNLPTDWKNPEWCVKQKVHNWRNYVSEDLEEIWDTFNDGQKMVLAVNFEDIACNEEWD